MNRKSISLRCGCRRSCSCRGDSIGISECVTRLRIRHNRAVSVQFVFHTVQCILYCRTFGDRSFIFESDFFVLVYGYDRVRVGKGDIERIRTVVIYLAAVSIRCKRSESYAAAVGRIVNIHSRMVFYVADREFGRKCFYFCTCDRIGRCVGRTEIFFGETDIGRDLAVAVSIGSRCS